MVGLRGSIMNKIKIAKDMLAGKIHQSKQCGTFEIVQYHSVSKVDIRFTATEYTHTVRADNISIGNVKDRTLPKICGVGYIGNGKYNSRSNGHNGKSSSGYRRWKLMLRKCYKKTNDLTRSFDDTLYEVGKEWHNFQNFAEWYYSECAKLDIDSEDNHYQIVAVLKAINSKVYSSYNCKLELE
jgi:hypothetical protein